MRIEGNPVIAMFVGDREADKIVPRIGLTAWLVVFTSGAMSFLAVFAMALLLTTQRIADAWTAELDRSATVRVSAPQGALATRTTDALRVLQSTPGVISARVFSDAEQQKLLEPWLGADLPVDRLPLPRLIEITVNDELYDADLLALRLEGEVPGTRLDDHARWRAPLISAAQRVRLLGVGAVVLIGAALGAMITLAARAALASNAQVISVLRLLGARDVFVARAFVRRLTLRAIGGALLGTAIALCAIFLIPNTAEGTGLLANFGFQGQEWGLVCMLPFVSGVVAFWATRMSALNALKRIP